MYVFCDVIGIVNLILLIVSFIMSKKIVVGVDVIVFDVKIGVGVFMKIDEDVENLVYVMVCIGNNVGRNMMVVIFDMF